MTPAILLLNQSIVDSSPRGHQYRWEDLVAAIEAIAGADSFGWEAERALLRALRFDGELSLSENSELPHSMSPEEMLKSLATQALAKRTGLTHLLEMERVEATAASPTLASIVRATIRRTEPLRVPKSGIGVVAEMRSAPARRAVRWPFGQAVHRKRATILPPGASAITVRQLATPAYYSKFDVEYALSGKKNIANKAVVVEHGLTFIPGRRGMRRPEMQMPAFAE